MIPPRYNRTVHVHQFDPDMQYGTAPYCLQYDSPWCEPSMTAPTYNVAQLRIADVSGCLPAGW